jgi:hypothetical protein
LVAFSIAYGDMEEEDDDFYAPSEPVISGSLTYPAASDSAAGSGATAPKEEKVEDELEEGEEEEEEEEEEEVESDSVALEFLPFVSPFSHTYRSEGYRYYHGSERWLET